LEKVKNNKTRLTETMLKHVLDSKLLNLFIMTYTNVIITFDFFDQITWFSWKWD